MSWHFRIYFVALATVLSPAAGYLGNPPCGSSRDVTVHLFEWKWSDVAAECPRLAALGYCAVQVSPPQEHAVLQNPGAGLPPYPWWQRYQPVSYDLVSRSGNEEQFANMVQVCNDNGVYILVDAIVQHMTGGQSGTGSAGSPYNGDQEHYPGVPYSVLDFHHAECNSNSGEIEDYMNEQQVRFCRLSGLRDLRTGSEYVQDRLVEFLNKMIDHGVAGFRVDACKHMLPSDLEALYNRLNNLPSRWFSNGQRPYVFQEVIYTGDAEPIRPYHYTHLARATEFRYSASIGEVFRKWNNQQLRSLENFGEGWNFINGLDAVVFVDNHDNQRGHGAGGNAILTHKDATLYKMATAFKLAWKYGQPRIMSSFAFDNTEQGPPSDGNGNTHDVDCFNGEWVCEHLWRQIFNMVRFHNTAIGSPVTNWDAISDHAIAFGRGGRGFIVINNEDHTVEKTFSTGMPDGEYCNVILCDDPSPPCSGEAGCGSVTVQGGQAFISVPNGEDPVVAIHV